MAGDKGMFVRIFANVEELKKALKDGTSTINTTAASMGKLASSLEGNKLIQHAQNIVAAVDKIGGATKLTESEKRRLNATLAQAVEKYQRLGKDAPKAMVDLEQATRRVEEPTNQLSTKMVALGSAIGSFVGNLAYDGVRRLGTAFAGLVAEGLRTPVIAASFDRLAGSIGQSGDAMLSVTRTATKGLITDLDIMQASNKAMLLGLPVTSKEMGTLSSAAVTLGKAMGQGANKSLDDLITALGRSSPMILDNLGLTVKVGEANEAYAAKLGRSVSSLTDAEKKMAFYNAAIEAAQAKVETLGGVQLTTADTGTRLATAFTNTAHAGGRLLDAAMTPLNAVMGAIPGPMLTAGVAIAAVGTAALATIAGVIGMNAAFAGGAIAAGTLTVATGTLTVAMTALGAAVTFFTGPLGIALAATAALTAGIVYLKNRISVDLEPAVAQASDGLKKFADLANEGAAKPLAMSWEEAEQIAGKLNEQIKKTNAELDRLAKIREQAFGLDKIKSVQDTVRAIGGIAGVAKMSADDVKKFSASLDEAIGIAKRNGLNETAAAFESLRQKIPLVSSSIDVAAKAMTSFNIHGTRMRDVSREAMFAAQGFTRDGLIPVVEHAEKVTLALQRAGMGARVFAAESNQAADKVQTRWERFVDRMTKHLNGLNNIFQAAFEGGGGVAGAVKSFATGVLEDLLNHIPIVGPMLSKFAGTFVAAAQKIWGAIRGVFGGPDSKELEGRQAMTQFIDGLRDGLNASQLEEVQRAVSSGWQEHLAVSSIAVRDAYLATGRSAEEADAMVRRLWASQVQGGAAVEAIISDIRVILSEAYPQAATAATDASTLGFDETRGAVADTIQTLKGLTGPEYEALKGRSVEILTLLHGLWTEVHNATLAARNAVFAVIDALGNLRSAIADIPRSLDIQVNYHAGAMPAFSGVPEGLDGFASGTDGFRDFGAGTPVLLHGREAVVPEGRAGEFAGKHAGLNVDVLVAEMQGLRRDLARSEARRSYTTRHDQLMRAR